MATRITWNGEETQVYPKDGKVFTLEELQAAVGGYIEQVPLNTGQTMFVNEEGKIRGLHANAKATRIATRESRIWDIIVGDVIVCEPNEIE